MELPIVMKRCLAHLSFYEQNVFYVSLCLFLNTKALTYCPWNGENLPFIHAIDKRDGSFHPVN